MEEISDPHTELCGKNVNFKATFSVNNAVVFYSACSPATHIILSNLVEWYIRLRITWSPTMTALHWCLWHLFCQKNWSPNITFVRVRVARLCWRRMCQNKLVRSTLGQRLAPTTEWSRESRPDRGFVLIWSQSTRPPLVLQPEIVTPPAVRPTSAKCDCINFSVICRETSLIVIPRRKYLSCGNTRNCAPVFRGSKNTVSNKHHFPFCVQ